jgi:hypothetical protein
MVRTLIIAGLVLGALVCQAAPAAGQAAREANPYSGYEMSSGFYEQYEVRPQQNRPFIAAPDNRQGVLSYGPSAAQVRTRGRLQDAHMGVRFYWPERSCTDCHEEKQRTRHVVRGNLQCRQCHGREPISDIDHYYSQLNTIRRHAYVCSKCHQGAGVSYATYVVHEPSPFSADTAEIFPLLYWAVWIMVGIAIVTFVLFLPHTALWGVREAISPPGEEKKEKDS